MNIEGTYTLQASPADVWRYLGNLQTLLQVFPGLERLEPTENNAYALTIQLKQAPLTGNYEGLVNITEKRMPYFCHLTLDSASKQNAFSGDAVIQLRAQADMTILHYKGNIRIAKTGDTTLPKLTKGAVKLLLQEFFTTVSTQLRDNEQSASFAEEEEFVVASINRQRASASVQQTPLTKEQTTSWLQRLIHLSGLGKHDPVQEEQWVARIKRIGIASGLLFLVWLGTRIPRRLS